MQMLFTAMLILVPAPPVDNSEPKGVAPTVRFVTWEGGNLMMQTTVTVRVPYTETVTQVVNGQQVPVTITKVRAALKTVKSTTHGNYLGYDLDGKKIDEKIWKKALEKGATVIIAGNDELPDIGYRKLFKEGILILVPYPSDPTVPTPPPISQ